MSGRGLSLESFRSLRIALTGNNSRRSSRRKAVGMLWALSLNYRPLKFPT